MIYDANYYKEKRLFKKKRLVDIMGGCCQNCGYNHSIYALEFHHLNPLEKKYTITDYLLKPLQQQVIELKKCILLCSNCHHAYHGGDIKKIFQSSYNEEKALLYIEEEKKQRFLSNSKLTTINLCPVCNQPIFSSRNKYCSKQCSYIGRSKIKSKQFPDKKLCMPDRNELKNLIHIYPFTQIGKMYGISDNAIRKWCRKYNLPATKKEIKSYSSEEWQLL